MRIALGSDQRMPLTDLLVSELQRRGHQLLLHGPPAGQPAPWAQVAEEVAREVASGKADMGVVCCWTGTGVSIAANKVPGVRAALCTDAETARGARQWNDANVLALSLRLTSQEVAREVLDAWFSAAFDPSEEASLARLRALDGARAANQEANAASGGHGHSRGVE